MKGRHILAVLILFALYAIVSEMDYREAVNQHTHITRAAR